jgi:RNA polymerase sigma factor (sigma-70 family)
VGGRDERSTATDADLLRAAGGGASDAFAELYRRHATAAHDLARGLTGNPDDAADAVAEAFTNVLAHLSAHRVEIRKFRSYLLTAVRHAAVDMAGARRHDVSIPDADAFTAPAVDDEPAQATIDTESRRLLTEAFGDLPERWRKVLWLTEVERRPPREAARHLGLEPNNVSQLAARARARLHALYLQAHVGPCANRYCRSTVARLGAHASLTLPRDQATGVARHLAGCTRCRQRVDELTAVDPRAYSRSAAEPPRHGAPPASRPVRTRPARRGAPPRRSPPRSPAGSLLVRPRSPKAPPRAPPRRPRSGG